MSFGSRSRPRSRSWSPWKKLLLGVAGSLLLLAFAEFVLRLLSSALPGGGPTIGFGGFRNTLVEIGGFNAAERLFEPDSELFWKLRPGVDDLPWQPKLWLDNRSNALGLHDVERRYQRPAGGLRILCLGDSCTYGTGVRLADTWPQRLEELLSQAYTDRVVEAWNGGCPGWSTDQGATFLAREGPKIRPDLVAITFGLNDARHWDLGHHQERGHGLCRTDRAARELLHHPLMRIDRALSRFALYRLIAQVLPAPPPPTTPFAGEGTVRVPDPEFRVNLRRMVADARALGARPVLVVWPIRWQLEPQGEQPLLEPTPYQIAVRETGRELTVPVFDLPQRMQGRSHIYVDSVHMNVEGCRLVAEELGRFLFAEGLLPPPPPPAPPPPPR